MTTTTTTATYTIDALTFGDTGFGRMVRHARTTEDWRRAHREATSAFEARYDEEKEAIKSGTPPSKEFLLLETIVTLTHEIVSTRAAVANAVRDIGL